MSFIETEQDRLYAGNRQPIVNKYSNQEKPFDDIKNTLYPSTDSSRTETVISNSLPEIAIDNLPNLPQTRFARTIDINATLSVLTQGYETAMLSFQKMIEAYIWYSAESSSQPSLWSDGIIRYSGATVDPSIKLIPREIGLRFLSYLAKAAISASTLAVPEIIPPFNGVCGVAFLDPNTTIGTIADGKFSINAFEMRYRHTDIPQAGSVIIYDQNDVAKALQKSPFTAWACDWITNPTPDNVYASVFARYITAMANAPTVYFPGRQPQVFRVTSPLSLFVPEWLLPQYARKVPSFLVNFAKLLFNDKSLTDFYNNNAQMIMIKEATRRRVEAQANIFAVNTGSTSVSDQSDDFSF